MRITLDQWSKVSYSFLWNTTVSVHAPTFHPSLRNADFLNKNKVQFQTQYGLNMEFSEINSELRILAESFFLSLCFFVIFQWSHLFVIPCTRSLSLTGLLSVLSEVLAVYFLLVHLSMQWLIVTFILFYNLFILIPKKAGSYEFLWINTDIQSPSTSKYFRMKPCLFHLTVSVNTLHTLEATANYFTCIKLAPW